MRARRYAGAKAWFAAIDRSAGIDPKSAEGRRLVRLSLLLTSSIAFLDLQTVKGSRGCGR